MSRTRHIVALGSAGVFVTLAVACSRVFGPPLPVDLGPDWMVSRHDAGEWRIVASDGSVFNLDEWRAIRGELEDQGCVHEPVDGVSVPTVRAQLGFFECHGTRIEVDGVAGDTSQLFVRVVGS